MRTKRFDFNFKPLRLNVSISVDGSVPERQNYNANAKEYTPDYTVTPVIIQPKVSCLDKDGILYGGSINNNLANVKWYEIVSGTSTLIDSTNANYEVTTSGDNAGRIKVKRNASNGLPITLQFYAEYVDTRTSQIYVVQGTKQIFCGNSTAYTPLLRLDAADTTIYNPFTDVASQVVTASLKLGTDECATANRIFLWEKWNSDDSAWKMAGTDDTLDYDISVSADGTSCTVRKDLIGSELLLRCRAKYDIDGNPGSVVLDDESPCKSISFVRRLPKFEFDYSGVPTNVPADIMTVSPEAQIIDTNGGITDPTRELLPLWYIAQNKASGSLSYSLVAHGMAPTISTSAMSQLYGAVIGLDVVDRGPWKAMEDGNGKVIVDGNGKVIIIH